uniref:DITP/XTP pyrophosphatase (RdgB) n=1 Tax=uncultured marine group II/III euryarchaeote KM3_109_G01 TaxID=1457850 RepID=A0A075G6W4_9EURY|nr:dITP/XTP pyrophosphatase (rdgB) [uncultured marine group II/III euryarchaeote KM3_109_G01]
MDERKLWFLTGNAGKLREASHLFATLGYEVLPFSTADETAEIVEPQSDSLEVVANSKLDQAWTQLVFLGLAEDSLLVEDSGLFIDHLGGFPGVYSATILAQIGLEGILKLLAGQVSEDPLQTMRLRAAEFRCCASVWNGREVLSGSGVCRGYISLEAGGSEGFGYDPIFIPLDVDDEGSSLDFGAEGLHSTAGLTFGEIPLQQKQMFSHRAEAMKQVCKQLLATSSAPPSA